MRIRADVAELLRAGATHRQICAQLHVSNATILLTRRTRGIPLPEGRRGGNRTPGSGGRRPREDIVAIEARTVDLLYAGVPARQIAPQVGIARPTVLRIRRTYHVPCRPTPRASRALEPVFALHARTEGTHLLWTGPWRGRTPTLYAEGARPNARAIAFERHHGRPPQGRMTRISEACDERRCIAGAHHADDLIRADLDLDALYDAIFTTPGDTP
ncbi:hypothetical protein AB0D74_48425 [Streptomyces sp. NPDC048278]|uniref:hypothetical protein n=1 Tax=Streptomyces sp. NPDC048278 TaxID=3155809 RepID=UPI00341A5B31